MGKRRPYAAIVLDMFEHPLFSRRRIFSDYEAWQWLILHAAWKPEGRRQSGSVVHVARAQLVATVRGLGDVWKWPKSRVERFLTLLSREEMIRLGAARGTRNRTGLKLENSYRVTLITLCNYDKYQVQTARASGGRRGQVKGQDEGQENPELPMALAQADSPPSSPSSPIRESSKRSAEQGQRIKPRHGSRGRGMVWFDHGSEEWTLYAADWREATRTDKLPERRIGGVGNWFRWLGETKRA